MSGARLSKGPAMDEQRWLASNSPAWMLEWLVGGERWPRQAVATDRKLRLWACAAWRYMRHTNYKNVPLGGCAAFVEAAEAFADGIALPVKFLSNDNLNWYGHWQDAREVAEHALRMWPEDAAGQAALLRDIFGNPYQTIVTLDGQGQSVRHGSGQDVVVWSKDCLIWNGGCIPRLAEAIYHERAFDRVPILADALEDAWETDRVILEHLRGGNSHVRGCWVIDLLLGKD